MKKILFIFLLFPFEAISQPGIVDDIRLKLRTQIEDTNRVKLLNELALYYAWQAADTAIELTQQAWDLSEKFDYEQGMVSSKLIQGMALTTLGNYSRALDLGLSTMENGTEHFDETSFRGLYSLLVICYRELGDYKNALFYIRESLGLANQRHFKSVPLMSYMGFATVYEKDNQPDSAILYSKIYLNEKKTWDSGILYPLANAFLKKNMYDSALYYFRKGAEVAGQNRIRKDLIDIYNGISKVYHEQGLSDSAIWYAKKVVDVEAVGIYPVGLMEATNLLANVYELKRMPDSSLNYLKKAIILKDSLFGRGKAVAVKNLEFKVREKQMELEASNLRFAYRLKMYLLSGSVIFLLFISGILIKSIDNKQKAKMKVEQAYTSLRSAQAQLIQAEKLASLGQLTAGIAHEIQNPLNFVNNFAEVNKELLDEIEGERSKEKGERNEQAESEMLNTIRQNLEKINFHGKRADGIVKNMLQHSQSSEQSGKLKKELTDINKLADEYLRLAYHGFRAKDQTFTATIKTDYDPDLGLIRVIPQDIARAMLNLINNAFYAVNEKLKTKTGGGLKTPPVFENYQPTVSITTIKTSDKTIEIRVKDNGSGIPQNVQDKIFQPFFTTKPTGQGTGLGLSLAYDILKAHGGEIKVHSTEGKGSEFILLIPIVES